MGLSFVHRGFSDEFMFAAMTSQKQVAGVEIPNPKKCKWVKRKKICEKIHQKWTWAIPLEIIYLTPLHKWNPYDIEYKGDAKSKEGKTVTANKRNGYCMQQNDDSKAYNGTNSRAYFRTPIEFFGSTEQNANAADTSRKYGVCVLDKKVTISTSSWASLIIVFIVVILILCCFLGSTSNVKPSMV